MILEKYTKKIKTNLVKHSESEEKYGFWKKKLKIQTPTTFARMVRWRKFYCVLDNGKKYWITDIRAITLL